MLSLKINKQLCIWTEGACTQGNNKVLACILPESYFSITKWSIHCSCFLSQVRWAAWRVSGGGVAPWSFSAACCWGRASCAWPSPPTFTGCTSPMARWPVGIRVCCLYWSVCSSVGQYISFAPFRIIIPRETRGYRFQLFRLSGFVSRLCLRKYLMQSF